jgi:hypothetical protein
MLWLTVLRYSLWYYAMAHPTQQPSSPRGIQLQNKFTNCVGVKNNTNFGQITGMQEKLGTTRK